MSATPEPRPLVRPVLVSMGFVLFVGPGPLTVLVPWLLSGWEVQEPLLGWTWLRGVGVALLVFGVPVLAESIARFVWKGGGTLAPMVPTRHLVISGLYRYVRNPMYVGVVAIIFGEALVVGSGEVLIYAAAVALGFHPLCRAVRGAHAAPHLRPGVRRLPLAGAPLDPSTHAGAGLARADRLTPGGRVRKGARDRESRVARHATLTGVRFE